MGDMAFIGTGSYGVSGYAAPVTCASAMPTTIAAAPYATTVAAAPVSYGGGVVFEQAVVSSSAGQLLESLAAQRDAAFSAQWNTTRAAGVVAAAPVSYAAAVPTTFAAPVSYAS